MQLIKISSNWGVYTWTDGFIPVKRPNRVSDEAKTNPEAVIARLMREGRWDEAEEVMDEYL
jgi:hypothetical protein